MNKSILTIKLLLLMLLSYTQQSNAQSTSWTGSVSQAWGTSANWTNGVPDATKDVFIGDAYYTGTFEPRLTVLGYCKSLTVGSVHPISVTIARSLRVFNNLQIETEGTINHGSSSLLYVGGNWVNNGNYNPTSANSQVNFTGSTQTISGTSTTNFIKLYVGRNATVILDKDITSIGTGSSIMVYGTINPGMSPSYQLTATGRIQVYDGGTIQVNKELFSDNYDISGGVVFYSGAIADYSSTVVNQTVSAVYNYATLKISGSGVKSLDANLPSFYSRSTTGGSIDVASGTFDMATFTANRGSFTSGGDFTIANGATVKLSGLSNFPRNFLRRSFAANSNVEYYGGNQNISEQTYGNLLISGTGTKSVTLSFSVQKDFTIQSSTLSCGSNAAVISVAGNMVQTGGTITGTAETLKMNGTTAQTLNLISAIPNLTIDNSSTGVILVSDVNVTESLIFTDGKISTGTNILALSSGATVTGAASTTGWVYGNLKKAVTSSGSITYEVGTSAQYTPAALQINALTAGGNITASSIINDHPEIDYSGLNPNKSINLYWDFTNEGVSFRTVDMAMSWTAPCMDAGSNTADFLAASFNGTDWRLETVSSRAAGSINISDVSSLTQFAVGEEVDQHYWTGSAFTTDWFTAKNWYGGVPGATTSVTLPNPLTPRRNYPVVTAGQTAQVKDIVIMSEAELILSEGAIEIYGNATSTGMFDATAGTVNFKGSAPQTVNSGLFYGNKVRDLIISNDVTLADVDSVTGTLTITEGNTLHTNENLTLKSDATGTARLTELPVDGSGTAIAFIDGTVNIERYIPARKAWRLLGVPVKASSAPTISSAWQEGAYGTSLAPNPTPHYGVHITGGSLLNGFDQSNTNLSSVKYYNPATRMFEGLPATPGTLRPISDFSGYMVYIRGDRSIDLMQGLNAAITSTTLRIKGEVLTGKQSTSVNAAGFTVLGNPYPSPINFASLVKDNVKNSFYIWDPKLAGSNGLGAYVTVSYNSGTGGYDVTTSASPISEYIPSGEAILIQSEDGVRAGTITINESDKTSSGSDFLFGRNLVTAKTMRVNLLGQDADGSYSLLDGSMTNYHESNKNAADKNDIDKLNNGSESISLIRDNRNLSIERRAVITGADTTFISMTQLTRKNYRLEVIAENMSAEGLTAVVTDRYKGISFNLPVDLTGKTQVDFNVNEDPASAAADRFSIIYMMSKTNTAPQPITKATTATKVVVAEEGSATVYPNPVTGNNINFKMEKMPAGTYKLNLYNIAGQLIATQEVKFNGTNSTMSMNVSNGFTPGRYDLRIEGQGKKISTRVLKQ